MKAEYGYLREAFMLRRYHTVGHIHKEETLGHHTANVIAIIFFLFDDAPPLYLVKAALHHDAPELATGDVPATAKWQFPSIAKALDEVEAGVCERRGLMHKDALAPEHQALLKYADMMDLCFKCAEEMAQGNESVIQILFNGLVFSRRLLANELKEHRAAHELYQLLRSNRFINIDNIYDGESLEPNATQH